MSREFMLYRDPVANLTQFARDENPVRSQPCFNSFNYKVLLIF